MLRTNNAVESFNHFLFLWFGIHPIAGVFIKLLIDLEYVLRRERMMSEQAFEEQSSNIKVMFTKDSLPFSKIEEELNILV